MGGELPTPSRSTPPETQQRTADPRSLPSLTAHPLPEKTWQTDVKRYFVTKPTPLLHINRTRASVIGVVLVCQILPRTRRQAFQTGECATFPNTIGASGWRGWVRCLCVPLTEYTGSLTALTARVRGAPTLALLRGVGTSQNVHGEARRMSEGFLLEGIERSAGGTAR